MAHVELTSEGINEQRNGKMFGTSREVGRAYNDGISEQSTELPVSAYSKLDGLFPVGADW